VNIIRNATEVAPYLGGLNECFGLWGADREWDWTFRRDCGAGLASRLAATDEHGSWIAGSAVSWRLSAAFGKIGIMTGSWTLPEARGSGCFSIFIRESAALVQSNDGGALLSFVTAANASRRRLEASGAEMIDTVYARSSEERSDLAAARLTAQPLTNDIVLSLWQMHARQTGTGNGFSYPDPEQFAGQFLRRPNPTGIYRDEDTDSLVIMEHASDTDRLLFAGGEHHDPREQPEAWSGWAAWAKGRDRKFFGFAIHPSHRAALRQTALEQIPGFLCVSGLAPDPKTDPGPAPQALRGDWTLQSGDRM
jgi:hypothetical protein